MKNKCPKCDGNISHIKENNILMRVLDGNLVYECDNNDTHKFWRNMREDDVLHYNPNSSETNFDSLADYEYINNEWKLDENK